MGASNRNLIKKSDNLFLALNSYTGNNKSVLELRNALSDLLGKIRSGQNITFMSEDEVPGVYQWKESGMAWPDDIRNSYFEFRKTISGDRSKGMEEFLKRVDKDGKL